MENVRASVTIEEEGAAALLSPPWTVGVHVKPEGPVLMFIRQERDARGFIVVAGRSVAHGLQDRAGRRIGDLGTGVTLAEAHRRTTDALEGYQAICDQAWEGVH